MAVAILPTGGGGEDGRASGDSLLFQILGPLRLWRGGVELSAGPRQQVFLLALLLAREGRPISTDELIDLIWQDDPPASALNVIHKYVGSLRRLLEPEISARSSGSFLQRRGNSYLFAAGAGTLDLVVFRNLVEAAGAALAKERHEEALDCYVEALELWQGPAGDGLNQGPAATSMFARLDGQFFDACTAAAELAVSLGRPARMLPSLHLAARMAPLHEPVQASLISTLGAAGQQAEALSVFRAVRARLAEDLGIYPGHALAAAHRRTLNQDLTETVQRAPGHSPTPVRAIARSGGVLVGRAEELTALRQAIEPAFTGGTGLIVLEGEPGIGKTRLLEELTAEAEQRDAAVVWARCLEGEGTPSMWPWIQAVGAVLDELPGAAREKWLAGELGDLLEPAGDVLGESVAPDAGAQFRLFEAAVAAVGQVAAQRPLVLVIDDLQWADVASLRLFSHLAARLPAGTAIIGGLRDRAPVPGSALTRTLAAASRGPGHFRTRLGPLGMAEVAELVRRETGQDPGPQAVRGIYTRTAGNPFFVRELALLLADSGALVEDAGARVGVPATVRDVVRDRMAGLDDCARNLLQIAALVGREVDLSLLAGVAGLDVQTCLDRLEPVEALGLLEPTPGNPFSFRFSHDLVRESVSETTPPGRANPLHLRVADTLERTDSSGDYVAERVAHHLWAAGPLADPRRTTAALVRAGRHAAAKSALEAAERQLRLAVRVARTASLAEVELPALSQLIAVVGMREMYGTASVDLLERAELLARRLGREVDAIVLLYSRWAAHAQALENDRSGLLARRLLAAGEASAKPLVRAYGLQAWGLQQFSDGNMGEAFRRLTEASEILLTRVVRREEDPVWYDLQLLMIGMLAEATAMHGDIDGARSLLDRLAAPGDDPFTITVWAAHTARMEALIGDPVRALRAAERGIAADPDFSFVFLGTYQRLARCWALAMTGKDPAGAGAEAERIIATNLLDPPRASVSTFYGHLCEMWLVAGALDKAAAALDRADSCLDLYGQRYAEGLLLLLRARLLLAGGESVAEVRAVAERCRALSTERGTHLFARRAEEFLATLDD
ncbi:BTAD domain-containing putative transcriptional regulator [Nonomuraea sp. NPDC049158]|uniref:BTAD domain-containing putative transcriptional regulator n=1 Tax=Nonomuraea sp. NPDC049158 TaxID=3155649 RepID=UPI0033C7AE11